MDAESTRPTSQAQPDAASPPTISPEVLDAIKSSRGPDAPRRCFICLTDQDPSDDPSSWVDPCPCTLEAHQDCMLSWVTDCERSNRPLRCPVCKSEIKLEGTWDPVVALHDAILRRFSRVSPYALGASFSVGVGLSMQMYGAMAMSVFSGQEMLLKFILGPSMALDGKQPHLGLQGSNILNHLQLMAVGPTLLFGQLTPGISNPTFVSIASFYGFYHLVRDKHFLTWPPSPQLALAAFPCIRALYYNLWREFAFPYEVQLNRQLQGLPPLQPQPQRNGRQGGQNHDEQRNGEGGIQGFLQGLIDALDPDDEERRRQPGARPAAEHIVIHEEVDTDNEGEDGEVLVELIIEEVVEDDNNAAPEGQEEGHGEAEAPEQQHQHAMHDQENAGAERMPPPNAPRDEPLPQPQHEAPQAPPARGPGLGSILTNISNAIVGALALPAFSFAMGEALRLVLPRTWTSGLTGGRPGLLQQQWGRSLMGGCLYVVLADVMRLYSKHRKVAAMTKRRVKNIERRRNRK